MLAPRPVKIFLCSLAASCVFEAPLLNAQMLIPIPRNVHETASVALPRGLHVVASTGAMESASVAADLNESLRERRIPTDGPFTVTLTTAANLPAEMQAEGYLITPGPDAVTLSAATPAGLFYAAQTLKQLIEHDGASAVLHQAEIRDWPAMRYRGVHDDLSRGPIPTLAFQKLFIRTLAAYKINVYSPYFEHTQQYVSQPLFAPPGGSISAEDARELVAFAARYHVTIVPEQEAFGHLHHNLVWEQYQDLAETPHGAVLAPGQPGSLKVIHAMFSELAGLYPGPMLHLGADETVDLGLGQTKAEVDERGLGPVYLDFLSRIVTDLAPLNRRLLFWGDIAQAVTQAGPGNDPDLLKRMPRAFKSATIAVAWEYNPQPTRGFSRFLTPFTAAGFETWVASGVNNWSRVWPNANDALPNIQGFVAEGQRVGSTGLLNTIWYDDGEALANNNWYELLFGAAAGWQKGTSSITAFQASYAQVFHGDGSGALNEAQKELMLCHALLRDQAHTGDGSDGIFWLDPWSPDGQKYAVKLRPFAHDLRMHAEHALTLIAQARQAAPPVSGEGAPARNSNSVMGEADSAVALNNPANALPSPATSLQHPDAIDALELGARRLDFIGLKFQLADEIVAGYARAQIAQASTDRKLHATVGRELSDLNGVNGKIQDILQTYALLRELYAQAWLRSNRPYALRQVLAHYDEAILLWQSRSDKFRAAQRQYSDQKTLPLASELGMPAR